MYVPSSMRAHVLERLLPMPFFSPLSLCSICVHLHHQTKGPTIEHFNFRIIDRAAATSTRELVHACMMDASARAINRERTTRDRCMAWPWLQARARDRHRTTVALKKNKLIDVWRGWPRERTPAGRPLLSLRTPSCQDCTPSSEWLALELLGLGLLRRGDGTDRRLARHTLAALDRDQLDREDLKERRGGEEKAKECKQRKPREPNGQASWAEKRSTAPIHAQA